MEGIYIFFLLIKKALKAHRNMLIFPFCSLIDSKLLWEIRMKAVLIFTQFLVLGFEGKCPLNVVSIYLQPILHFTKMA